MLPEPAVVVKVAGAALAAPPSKSWCASPTPDMLIVRGVTRFPAMLTVRALPAPKSKVDGFAIVNVPFTSIPVIPLRVTTELAAKLKLLKVGLVVPVIPCAVPLKLIAPAEHVKVLFRVRLPPILMVDADEFASAC